MKNPLSTVIVSVGVLVGIQLAQTAMADQCINLVDHYNTAPIRLDGKLVVTYYEKSIDGEKHDSHELGVLDFANAGAGIRRLTKNTVNESEVDVSPDGKEILYTVRQKLDDFDHNGEIWKRNIDGSNAVKLLEGKKFGGPVWHPDGKNFTYIVIGGKGELHTMNLISKAKARRPLTVPPKLLKGPEDPEVSYDGSQVTLKMNVQGDPVEQPSIYVMNSDGSNLRRLTGSDGRQKYSDHDPVFSRDSKKIYFERFHGGGKGDWFDCSQERTMAKPFCQWWSIVEVDIATKQEKTLMPHDPCGRHFFWLPTVSPDGKNIMYLHHDMKELLREGGTKSDVWVSEISGANPQKVRGSEGIYFFDWSK